MENVSCKIEAIKRSKDVIYCRIIRFDAYEKMKIHAFKNLERSSQSYVRKQRIPKFDSVTFERTLKEGSILH